MLNPLLDVDLLRFWSALPDSCRAGKRLFKECYHRYCGDHLDVPIATLDNGIDWPRTLADTPALAAAVRAELRALPECLNRTYFEAKLEATLRGDGPAPPSGRLRIPPVKLVARAVVLGRWWRNGLVAPSRRPVPAARAPSGQSGE